MIALIRIFFPCVSFSFNMYLQGIELLSQIKCISNKNFHFVHMIFFHKYLKLESYCLEIFFNSNCILFCYC